MKYPVLITFIASIASSTMPLWAQSSDPNVVNLNKISVTALREETTIEGSGTSITQINATHIARQNASNLNEALMYEPGVSTDNSSRGGISNVRIRGLGDERVLMLIDGVPLPDAYAFGQYLNAGRQYFDIDHLKTIEIIKGPASVLYGSNALAGTVAMISKDPLDYLNEEKKHGGELKMAHNTAAKSTLLSLTGAAKITDSLSAMVRYTGRNYSETQNIGRGIGHSELGAKLTTPNPEDNTMQNFITKFVFMPNDDHKLSLSYEQFSQKTKLQVQSRENISVGRDIVKNTHNRDQQERQQLSIAYEFKAPNPLFDTGKINLYFQKTQAEQDTFEIRERAATRRTPLIIADRKRSAWFTQKNVGLDTQFSKHITTDYLNHDLTYGLGIFEEKVKTLRTGDTVNRSNGQSIEAESFPNQGFPDSKIRKMGFFIQDRIGLFEERLELIPGVRYDQYRLKPKQNGAYMRANSGIKAPVGIKQDHISKRFAILFHPNDANTMYFNYTEGFRAPSFSAVNVGFSNLQQGYTAIPNPDLKPETSQSFELGWHFKNHSIKSSLVGFYNKYDHFIDDLHNEGKDPVSNLTIFKSINLDKAKIYGAEASFDVLLSDIFNLEDQVSFNSAIAYAKGRDIKSNQPINSIDPLNGTLGLTYARDDQFRVSLKWRLFQAKKLKDLPDDLAGNLINSGSRSAPGYGKLDLMGEYWFSKNAVINAGVYNLTNQKHWDWGDRTRGTDLDAASIHRSSQPGINAAISVKLTF